VVLAAFEQNLAWAQVLVSKGFLSLIQQRSVWHIWKSEPCFQKLPAGSCFQTDGNDKMYSLISQPELLQEVHTIFILYLL